MPASETLLGGQQDIRSYPKPLFQSEAKIVQSHCNQNDFFILKQMNSLTQDRFGTYPCFQSEGL